MASKRVLILDDDPMVGLLIEMVAQSAGAETLRCEVPQPFLDALATWQPTHLVLDMRMPDMTGVEVLAELASGPSRSNTRCLTSSFARHVKPGMVQQQPVMYQQQQQPGAACSCRVSFFFLFCLRHLAA